MCILSFVDNNYMVLIHMQEVHRSKGMVCLCTAASVKVMPKVWGLIA